MRTLSGLVVLALILPAVAAAQTEPSKAGRSGLAGFKVLDGDGDGGLSLAELRARGREKGAEALFTLMDADGDGRLSLKEFTGAGNGGRLGRFDAYDRNKDGFVSRGEFPNFIDPLLLTALDRNHDRRVSLSEIRPAFAGSRVRQARVEPPARKAAPATRRPQGWCWVTGFGSDQWIIEGPVSFESCRTQ